MIVQARRARAIHRIATVGAAFERAGFGAVLGCTRRPVADQIVGVANVVASVGFHHVPRCFRDSGGAVGAGDGFEKRQGGRGERRGNAFVRRRDDHIFTF